MFPVVRLLVPKLDSERSYRVGASKLAQLYIAALSLQKESRKATALLNFGTDQSEVGGRQLLEESVTFLNGAFF